VKKKNELTGAAISEISAEIWKNNRRRERNCHLKKNREQQEESYQIVKAVS
jgi:hypothetical protein